jgi:glycolate oxidase iron-sulfur subunit
MSQVPAPHPLACLDYSFVQQCIHCGLCLPTCPTYQETGRERNSPRGRIALMRSIADGDLAVTPAFGAEMDYCLGCLACVSACPAGVDYHLLFEASRAAAKETLPSSLWTRLLRAASLRFLFGRSWALRMTGRLLWVYQNLGLRTMIVRLGLLRLAPKRLRELEPLAPKMRSRTSDQLIGEFERCKGTAQYRVAMLTGCVQDLAFSEVNRATVDVLLENRCDVVTPRSQGCCGSLHAHNGDPATAKALARSLIDRLDPGSVDAILSNAAGCGSHLKHFDRLLADDADYRDRAALWSAKVRDISEWLVEIGFRKPEGNAEPKTVVVYQDACHLCHAQKITEQPRQILRSIPGLVLKDCAEATWCCGSAGTYSLTQPQTSAWLRQRKLTHLGATGAPVIATANPGCHIQLQNGLAAEGKAYVRVTHPVVLLAEAYHRVK